MDYSEFRLYFWAYMGDTIISPLDRNVNNVDFCEEVCFGSYRIYQQSSVDIDVVCKQAENILFNVYRFKPLLGT